jgi:hypothetical protein
MTRLEVPKEMTIAVLLQCIAAFGGTIEVATHADRRRIRLAS